jgi:hypothetical protein
MSLKKEKENIESNKQFITLTVPTPKCGLILKGKIIPVLN